MLKRIELLWHGICRVFFTRYRNGQYVTNTYTPGTHSLRRLERTIEKLDSPWGYDVTLRGDGWALELPVFCPQREE